MRACVCFQIQNFWYGVPSLGRDKGDWEYREKENQLPNTSGVVGPVLPMLEK